MARTMMARLLFPLHGPITMTFRGRLAALPPALPSVPVVAAALMAPAARAAVVPLWLGLGRVCWVRTLSWAWGLGGPQPMHGCPPLLRSKLGWAPRRSVIRAPSGRPISVLLILCCF